MWFAVKLGMDAVATDRLIVGADTLTIESSGLLRAPLALRRTDIAAVVVDPLGATNAHERLRFPLGDHREYVYSSVRGSVLPLLSREPAIPTVAIVFSAPHAIPQSRWRFVADAFAPLRPLEPGVSVPGLLLATTSATETRDLLADWEDAAKAGTALIEWQQSVIEKVERRTAFKKFSFSATRTPITSQQWSRWILPPAGFMGLLLALALQARAAVYSTGSEIALAVAFLCILAGGTLDRLRHYEERTGRNRLLGLALVSVGVFTAIAVVAGVSSHGVAR